MITRKEYSNILHRTRYEFWRSQGKNTPAYCFAHYQCTHRHPTAHTHFLFRLVCSDFDSYSNSFMFSSFFSLIIMIIILIKVTIIQGETGCGKSSRVPALILAGSNQPHKLKMFVSQPRRIAATTLKKRVAEVLGSRVGLRLGNGIRDECKDTQIWYCTAGYLSRE